IWRTEMGMRSKNYLVIKPGHELAADAAKYLKSSLEERTGEGALYAWESNFTPMWARDAGVGHNVGDLREEAAIQGFLSSLPRDAFYLKRAGAECGARGTWSDHPFSIHPVVIDVDTDYAGLVGTESPGQQNAHTGRKKQLTVALALTHMEGRLGSDEARRGSKNSSGRYRSRGTPESAGPLRCAGVGVSAAQGVRAALCSGSCAR